jgi:plastocyanin
MKLRVALALLLAVTVFGLAAMPSGGAQTVTVTLTATGPQPQVVTVQWGDTVNFVNGDTVAHDIQSSDPLIGNKTLNPGDIYPVLFNGTIGHKSYIEVAKPRSFYGPGIVVALDGAKLSLATKQPAVVYGTSAVLSGVVSPASAQVTIQSQPLNIYGNALGDWKDAGPPITPAADGSYQFHAKVTAGTAFRASAAAGQLTSQMLKVFVLPVLTLQAPAKARAGDQGKLTIVLSPANASSTVDLQAFSTKFGQWQAVAHLTVPRSGRIRTSWTVVPGRTKLRAAIPSQAIAAGLTPVTSKPRTVVGK